EQAHPERHLHLRLPVLVVLDLERLHAGHQRGHLGRVVHDVPDDLAVDVELAIPFYLHRVTSGCSGAGQAGASVRAQAAWQLAALLETPSSLRLMPRGPPAPPGSSRAPG